MTDTTIDTFIQTCSFPSGYCQIMKRDYARFGFKEQERFCKKILAHDYGWEPAKMLRDLVRMEMGFEIEEEAA